MTIFNIISTLDEALNSVVNINYIGQILCSKYFKSESELVYIYVCVCVCMCVCVFLHDPHVYILLEIDR